MKLSKSERIAKHLLDNLYADFVNPGKYATLSFDKNTYDIKKYIESFIFLSYIRKVPIKSLEKALIFGEKYWKEKIDESA